MPAYMNWSCKVYKNLDERDKYHIAQNEFSVPFINNIGFFYWERHVWSYSRLKLIHEHDRLKAIGGLVKKFSKTRPDSYLYGLWASDLPRQLLWHTIDISEGMKGVPDLPSWTWASQPGRKNFVYIPISGKFNSEVMHNSKKQSLPGTCAIVVSADGISGTIKLQGSLVSCELRKRLDGCYHDKTLYPSAESTLLETKGPAVYQLWSRDTDIESMMRIVQLDGPKLYDHLYCSVMIEVGRDQASKLRKGEESNPTGFEDPELQVYADKMGNRADECLDDYVRTTMLGMGEY
jgi:hypothetical protein